MKHLLLGAAAAAMALSGFAASAQPYGGRDRGGDRGQEQHQRGNGQGQTRSWNGGGQAQAHNWNGGQGQTRSWNGGGRAQAHNWNGGQAQYRGGYNRGGGQFAQSGRYRAGGYYPGYARRDRMISDWRAYHLPAPRAGYGYYYDDDGDVVMAALASGLIGMVIGNAIADQGDDGYAQPYGYQQPYGYAQPYGYPQPYGQPY